MVRSFRDQLQSGHLRASAGLTAIDARVAGSTRLHEAAACGARRTVANVMKELPVVDRAGCQLSTIAYLAIVLAE